MFKKLKITCDEATTICDKSQYGEASVYERLLLNIHFLKCKICVLYTKQNNLLSNVYKMKTTDCKKEHQCLSSSHKEELKRKLKEVKT